MKVQETLNRMELVIMMNRVGLELGLVKTHCLEDIMQCCTRLVKHEISGDWMIKKFPNIQNELIRNGQFAEYLSMLMTATPPLHKLETMLSNICRSGESITDFPIEHVMETLFNEKLSTKHDVTVQDPSRIAKKVMCITEKNMCRRIGL